MPDSKAMQAEREEAELTYVLGERVKLIQPRKGFRTSIDSILVAAACPVQNGQRLLDMGCGVGGASFCVLNRVPEAHVTGVDIQKDYIALAIQNAQLNSREEQCNFIAGDITAQPTETRFDHVICNPPYLEAGHHIPSPVGSLARARGHEQTHMTVERWVGAGFHRLRSGGSLTMIHRADNTDRIIRAMGRRFGAIDIIPLWPKQGRDAKRVIIRGIKDRQSPATFHAGLILHEPDNSYTPAAKAIIRQGRSLLL